MAITLIDRWLAHYDPLHRGLTPRGIANGLCATGGFTFPRIRGGYNLYRSVTGVPLTNTPPVGAAGADATTVRTFPWISHQADSCYVYRLTSLNGGGAENVCDEIVCVACFDAEGRWVGLRPNAVSDLRLNLLADGRFEVAWSYSREGEQVEPAYFEVFHDGGSGEVDFDTVVGTVAYRRGRVHYAHVSEPFAHDARVRWAVRAVSAEGARSESGAVVTGRAAAQPPAGRPTVLVELAEV